MNGGTHVSKFKKACSNNFGTVLVGRDQVISEPMHLCQCNASCHWCASLSAPKLQSREASVGCNILGHHDIQHTIFFPNRKVLTSGIKKTIIKNMFVQGSKSGVSDLHPFLFHAKKKEYLHGISAKHLLWH